MGILVTAFLALAAQQARFHEVEAAGAMRVEAVSYTMEAPNVVTLFVAARVQGEAEKGGVWTLKILGVELPNGAPLQTGYPVRGAGDKDEYGFMCVAASNLIDIPTPTCVRADCVLVHYRVVNEMAEFPSVRLKLMDPDHPRQDMRNWIVPKDSLVKAETVFGLQLAYYEQQGFGYVGGGYKDMAWLPVKVDRNTLGAGIPNGVAERVDAYVKPNNKITIYDKDLSIDGRTIAIQDPDFREELALTLHIERMIPDKRYNFAFVLPVQPDKDFWAHRTDKPDSRKFIRWPLGGS